MLHDTKEEKKHLKLLSDVPTCHDIFGRCISVRPHDSRGNM